MIALILFGGASALFHARAAAHTQPPTNDFSGARSSPALMPPTPSQPLGAFTSEQSPEQSGLTIPSRKVEAQPSPAGDDADNGADVPGEGEDKG